MFEKFLSAFRLDMPNDGPWNSSTHLPSEATGLENFLKSYSGCSFNNGLYRVHAAQNIANWNRLAGKAFPEFSEHTFCFGYDWLGRQFALDTGRIDRAEPLVIMLEPGTGQALEISASFLVFHENELLDYADAALAQDFFDAWLSAGNAPPSHDQCIGYRKPLFLGGADDIENLEPVDLEVYWGVDGQLLDKVRKLPPGTPVGNITIE